MPSAARRRAVAAVAAVVAGLSVAVAGCGGGHPAPRAASPEPTPTRSVVAPRPSPPPVEVSPYTGLPGGSGGPVLAVKVDNTAQSHPQVGIGAADLVYVEEVEGGVIRLLAVFNSRLPAEVGPVRSARLNDLELVRQFGHVALAFSGANAAVLAAVRAAPVTDMEGETTAGWFRGHGRRAPYNLFVRPQQVLAAVPGAAAPSPVGFTFAAPVPAGGRPATGLAARWSAYARIDFAWDATAHAWRESMDGAPRATLDGGPIGPTNVLVQYVRQEPGRSVDVLGNPSPYTVTTGGGSCLLLRDGRVYDGTWSRPSADSPTTWAGADGSPLALHPGTTWILLVPAEHPVTVS